MDDLDTIDEEYASVRRLLSSVALIELAQENT